MLISQVKSNRIRVLIDITDDDVRYLIISNMLTTRGYKCHSTVPRYDDVTVGHLMLQTTYI